MPHSKMPHSKLNNSNLKSQITAILPLVTVSAVSRESVYVALSHSPLTHHHTRQGAIYCSLTHAPSLIDSNP